MRYYLRKVRCLIASLREGEIIAARGPRRCTGVPINVLDSLRAHVKTVYVRV